MAKAKTEGPKSVRIEAPHIVALIERENSAGHERSKTETTEALIMEASESRLLQRTRPMLNIKEGAAK
jgi:hypothetical protein